MLQHLPAETSRILRGRHASPAIASGDWRKSEASVMDTVKHRPAVAANIHRRPPANLLPPGILLAEVNRESVMQPKREE
jgi:hypothetical protein